MIGAGYFLFTGMCKNTIISSNISSNKKWKLVLFERNCGATTGFSTQVSLLKVDKELGNESGNIYIAEGYPKRYTLMWNSDTTATISGTSGANFKKETRVNGIQFKYEQDFIR
jgi:hypothetical protein